MNIANFPFLAVECCKSTDVIEYRASLVCRFWFPVAKYKSTTTCWPGHNLSECMTHTWKQEVPEKKNILKEWQNGKWNWLGTTYTCWPDQFQLNFTNFSQTSNLTILSVYKDKQKILNTKHQTFKLQSWRHEAHTVLMNNIYTCTYRSCVWSN